MLFYGDFLTSESEKRTQNETDVEIPNGTHTLNHIQQLKIFCSLSFPKHKSNHF